MHRISIPLVLLLAACSGSSKDSEVTETGTTTDPGSLVDFDGDGFSPPDDCNDADPDTYPGAIERCDGVDNGCDGDNETQVATIQGGATFADLQAALDAAEAGDEIVVCPGTYSGPFSVPVELELVSSEGAEVTILSGGGAGATLDVLAGPTRVEGFSVRDGVGSPNGPSSNNGGAINGEGGFLEVVDCVVSDSLAEYGGGIHFGDAGGLLEGSSVVDNAASNLGGGVYATGTVVVRDSEISGNVATNNGGGLFLSTDAVVELESSVVSDNQADAGGGAFLFKDGTLQGDAGSSISDNSGALGGGVYLVDGVVDGLLIEGNTASEHGGGLYVLEGAEIVGATIEDNIASDGGGMYLRETVVFTDVTASLNTAFKAGGGAYLLSAAVSGSLELTGNTAMEGGGANLTDSSLTGAEIWANDAESGGGVHILGAGGGVSDLSDAFIHDNTCDISGGGVYARGDWQATGLMVTLNISNSRGGGIYSIGVEATLTDAEVRSNAAVERGGGLYLQSDAELEMIGGELDGNQSLRGAGVYINEESFLTLSGTAVTNNGDDATTISGGGVRVTDGTLDASDVDFSGNEPQDIYVEDGQQEYNYGLDTSVLCTATLCALQ